ncbi:DUF5666 domain-containing protein [Alcanivorax sp. DP30]|uniref:DUF5666 domain-containing protein n=1 Tax=Alcanivorax sp. DP30 TaxID=2606217 RepID=UPI00136F6150|nr:DUF5666 domain-containing protein [Alcanivorax sp. DP30]MZR63975.1 hypothetical protein [Alcanivorax sp. DP30]
MKGSWKALPFAALFAASTPVIANDLEGLIESVDTEAGTFVVQGITFVTSATTFYEDGLKEFSDLHEGQRVEVDFQFQDGKHVATLIELESHD